jgi:di- and tripeptidase
MLKSECFKGAKFLYTLLESLGVETRLIQGAEGKNPLVFGRLGNDPALKTIVIYGHYDVVPAAIEDGWETPPFELTGRDGYLYGRGAIDDKGTIPIEPWD